ncbi:hypothetical protein ACFQH6_06770 [Halobacteriaceae archaeon GCM10025711]
MRCPTCDYEFDETNGLQCPRCGEALSCGAVSCGDCNACSGGLFQRLKRSVTDD